MTDTDSLYFWKICVHRRQHQLAMLEKSSQFLRNKTAFETNEYLEALKAEQEIWIYEQSKKLRHAERMVKEFEK